MHDRPSLIELVQAAQRFVADVARPQLSGHAAFHARVASNALAIVARELSQGAAAETREAESLRALLPDAPQDASLDALRRRLCDEIQAGAMNTDTPGLLKYLKTTTIDQLNVDQPSYSGLAAALER